MWVSTLPSSSSASCASPLTPLSTEREGDISRPGLLGGSRGWWVVWCAIPRTAYVLAYMPLLRYREALLIVYRFGAFVAESACRDTSVDVEGLAAVHPTAVDTVVLKIANVLCEVTSGLWTLLFVLRRFRFVSVFFQPAAGAEN